MANIQSIITNGNNNVLIGTTTDSGFRLNVSGTQYVSGNVSIGTTYNGFALNVAGTTYVIGASVWVQNGYGYVNSGATSTGLFPKSDNTIEFRNNNATNVLVDASGNVGIKATPSAWASGYSVLNVGDAAAISWTGAGANDFSFSTNAYYDTTDNRWEYRGTGDGSARYSMTALSYEHRWYNAPVGTANAAISYTQAMTLTGGGNLLIGTTTDVGAKLYVDGNIRTTQALLSGGLLEFTGAWSASPYNGSAWVRPPAGVGVFLVNNAITRWAGFKPNDDFVVNSDNLVVNSSTGNVGIGTTVPGSQLQVGGSGVASVATPTAIQLDNSYRSSVGGNTSLKFYLYKNGNETYGIGLNNAGGIEYHSGLAGDTGSYQAFYFGNSEKLRFNGIGNVLIGTTTDNEVGRLILNGFSGLWLPYIAGTSLSYNQYGIVVGNSNTANANIGGGLTLVNNTASVGAYSPVISWSSMSAGGTYNSTYAFITGVYGGQGGDANWAIGDIIFGTAESYGASERMRIRYNGNVLIGTTTDSGYKLRVNGSSYFDAPILCYTGNAYITAITSDGVGSNNGFGYSFLITGANHEIGRVTGIYETSNGGGSGGLGFWTRGSGTLSTKMTLNSGGTLTLNNYGSGSKTGTVAYNLAVDASGNIIETAGGVVDGSGTANKISKWQDANTLTDANITDNGSTVRINSLPLMADSRLAVGTAGTDQTYASIFIGGDITTGANQYALLLDPQLSGTNNYGLFANARIKASHAATNAYGVYIVNNELLSGASVVNNYGLYIANQTNGSSANYALYSAGGTSYFAGNVGIGTTSPQTRLQVNGSHSSFVSHFGPGSDNTSGRWSGISLGYSEANANYRKVGIVSETIGDGSARQNLHFLVDTANDSLSASLVDSKMMIAGLTGNVLIGTTTDAGDKLRVNGTSYFDGLAHFGQTATSGSAFRWGAFGTAVSSDTMLCMNQLWNGSGWTIINSGVGTTYLSLGSSAASPDIQFGTGPANTAATTKMIILNNGNVGIGTTGPSAKLEVYAGSNSTANTILWGQTIRNAGNTANTGYGVGLKLKNSTDSGPYELYKWAGIASVAGSNYSDRTDLAFYTNAGVIAEATEKVRITGDGNLGIGTIAPGVPLSVAGVGGSTKGTNGYLVNIGGTDGNVDPVRYMIGFSHGDVYTAANVRAAVGMMVTTGGAGNLVFETGSSGAGQLERMRINGSGDVGINNSNPSYKLDVTGDARISSGSLGVGVAPNATDGRIDASNDIVAYQTSDRRLKENITTIANALDKVKSLTGVEFDWKEETKHVHGYEGHDTGIIAQEVQAVMPTAVRTNDSGYLSVRYEKLIGLLVEANKELAARVEELEAKLK